MPSFCVVSNCEHKYTHSENVSFHKFPRHSKELLLKWIQFTDRGFDWKPSRWSSVCSRHFLPSDFRESTSARKCLKRDAIPSITINNFDGSFLDLQGVDEPRGKFNENTREEFIGSSCRLCGLCCSAVATFSTNFEIFGMIQKCFPSLNIQQDDNLPKDLCPECLQRLHSFSDFIDSVLKTQKDFENKFSMKSTNVPLVSFEKPIKIKQEPTTKIKQEISEGLHDVSNDDFDVGIDEDQFADQKSQFSEFPFINPQEIINNCDIMEIISLDDAFIDIPDDEGGTDEPKSEPEEPIENAFYLGEEHNYCKLMDNKENLDEGPYKTEKSEEAELFQAETPKACKDMIVINESIEMPIPAFDLFQCKDCPMQFLTEGILAEHRKLNHSFNEHLCALCNESFKSFFHFLRHKLIKHKRRPRVRSSLESYPCPMCKKACATKLALNNHKKYICKYQQEKSYACKYCSKTLKKWIYLRQHEKECRKSRNSINSAGPSIFSKPLEALKEVNGSFPCKLCGRIYRSRRNVLQHEKSHRPIEQWNYKCGDCEKMFDFCQDLRNHLKNRECRAAPIGVDHVYFVCTTCGSQFQSLTKLKWHNMVHTGAKPFVCESCGKSFRSFNNLYQHKITHTTVRRHKCDLCDKTFKRRGGLNQHKRAFHLRLRPHECPVCKHKFALKGDMVRCKHSALKDRGLENF